MTQILPPGLFILPNVFSHTEAKTLIDLSESKDYQAAMVKTSQGAKLMTQIRKNQRQEIDDATLSVQVLARLRHQALSVSGDNRQLHQVLHDCCNINPAWRYYRYDTGDYFKWHRDGRIQGKHGSHSLYTVLIYLNQGYQGGQTCFRTYQVQAETGMAVIFHQSLLHQGAELVSGSKYVLRSDLMFEST